MIPSVSEAYRACREIARKEARNFYYAFVALPPHKRDAICAVYAFMRRAVFQEFNVTTGPLSRELCRNPLTLKDGFLEVPQGPGLGVEVDEATIEKYRVG